jgi:hypothetical protein
VYGRVYKRAYKRVYGQADGVWEDVKEGAWAGRRASRVGSVRDSAGGRAWMRRRKRGQGDRPDTENAAFASASEERVCVGAGA